MADEKWERKKRYLFWSILVNPGYRLSPETEELLSDNLVDGPYSPLPDLIIEPEPNRHDDPPEVYQELEARMGRLHKRLFVEDRESSAQTEDLINENEEFSTFDRNQTTPSTFSHHREDDRATSADSETLNPTNIFKEIQNVSKSVESKDELSKVEFVNSPIISSGSRALSAGNRSNETNLTETDLDFTQIISTARDYTKELQEMLNKTKINETQQSELEFRKSPIVSYGRRALSVEKRSNETELTELDMDFTQVISTIGNKTKETTNITNSSDTEDERSKSEFGNSVTFGTKPLIVDENETSETEETESDIDNTHVILTTVAEIHEEPLSEKTVIFETKSPVLIPTLYKKNSSNNFRALPESTGNISLVDKDKVEEVNRTDLHAHNVENISENMEGKTNEQSDSELDLEVETILKNAEAVSNLDRLREVNRDSETNEEVSSEGEDLFVFLKGSQANTENESVSDETVENTIRSNVPRRKRSRDADSDTDNTFEVALRRSAFDRVKKRKTSKQSSDDEINTEDGSLTSEERIDSKDYDDQSIIKRCQHDDENSENDSFEMALRRELFERINRSKGYGRAPEELDSASGETEVIEEMRGAPQVKALQAFQRKSTASQESLQGTFAKPSVAEMQEDISMDVAGHSVSTLDRTQDEGSLQDSVAQDSPVLSGFTAQTHTGVHFQEDSIKEHLESIESLQVQNSSEGESMEQKSPVKKRAPLSSNKPIKSFPTEVKQSSIGSEEATPSAPDNNVISTSIWSVSPIPISTADFLNATSIHGASNENLAVKRRQSSSTPLSVPKKRKKYVQASTQTDQFVQASTQTDPWENIRANFFVGTPRIFKLCSCSDHTCP